MGEAIMVVCSTCGCRHDLALAMCPDCEDRLAWERGDVVDLADLERAFGPVVGYDSAAGDWVCSGCGLCTDHCRCA